MGTELGGTIPDSATFAHALDSLKQEGSNILLVGESATQAHKAACHRLLGESGDDPRYRLFVVTERPRNSHGFDCTCSGGHGHEETMTRVIVRAADETDEHDTVLGEDGNDSAVSQSVVGTELLSVLGSEVIDTVTAFDEDADGLEPSELRVCVDSLAPLLVDHRPENVFRLLHVITSWVRQVNGMGHFHLPVALEHDAVNLLEPLFDAIVEVRANGGTNEQRWHLRDQRTSSEWLPL
ncbi:DUF7504 family protein [Natronobiforma cellulositropha]|uniref:DUF7504 family protein n=1 Tax=Natronobiforma cellulositropha TaxID=1679076 RepID=UPI0021D5C0E8|nr:hypothetical protein [Natronobiforma cellulositropha]